MPEQLQLSVNDRVLLHLSRFATDMLPAEFPPECTQAGIALAVGISRTHVPRAVKGLVKEGLVSELSGRVEGHERRMRVYAVTPDGLKSAEKLWEELRQAEFSVIVDGEPVKMQGSELERRLGKRRALAAISQMKNGKVHLEEARRVPVRDLNEAPELGPFYGREAELDALESFMDGGARVLVVLGNRGYGVTSLVRKFVEGEVEADVLWVHLSPDITVEAIEQRMVEFGKKVRKGVQGLSDVLKLSDALVVFDDYFSVPDEVVEFFSSLVDAADGIKIIVNARQETPAYNWFYQRRHVEAGIVQELRIKGLDEESARKLLGNERIEKDALKRIMMMTHGQPRILKMLRENDHQGLRRDSLFSAEEIRYLLFLKDRTE